MASYCKGYTTGLAIDQRTDELIAQMERDIGPLQTWPINDTTTKKKPKTKQKKKNISSPENNRSIEAGGP